MSTHIVIVEEYHLMAADASRADIGRPTLCTQIATAGKRGIRFIFSNQLLSALPEEIHGNVACRIAMKLTTPRCLWLAQRSMGLSPEQAAKLPELGAREAIVQTGEHAGAFKVRIDEFSFPPPPDEADLEAAAQAFLAETAWTEEAEVHAPAAAPDLALTGDALKVFIRLAENSAETIPDRCQALGMDRAQEVRARKVLEAKGFVAQVQQTLGNRIKCYELTEKGTEWAQRHIIKVRRYKSGPLHAYLLNQVEKAIGSLGPRFAFQHASPIAREHGLEPDSVLHLPGGQRVLIEICCSNMDYEAGSLMREREVEGVDLVVAVTPNQHTKQALEKAVERCHVEPEKERTLRPLVILDAGTCLEKDFDWAQVFERPV